MPVKSRAVWNDRKWKLPLLLGDKRWNLISHFTSQQNTHWTLWKCWSFTSGLGNDSETRVDSSIRWFSASTTYCSQGSPWLELLSSRALMPIGPHTPFHFPPREEEDRPTFLPVWIWATGGLRWRIIFFLNIVIFEWGSFHFNLSILIFNDTVIVLYGGRR